MLEIAVQSAPDKFVKTAAERMLELWIEIRFPLCPSFQHGVPVHAGQ
jgi:hypothetical protein